MLTTLSPFVYSYASIIAKTGMSLAFFLTLQQIYQSYWQFEKKQTMWYLIHFSGNAVIVLLTAPDMVYSFLDPLSSANHLVDYHSPFCWSSYPIYLMVALHLFHIIYYYHDLVILDWIHHGLNCGIIGSLCIFYLQCRLSNHGLFFMCGLPGGIDYFLLFINDLGYIRRITEKKINTYLNMYLRLPGIIANCLIGIFCYLYVENLHISFGVGLIIILGNYWNAVFFAYRVVQNYGIHLALQQRKIY